MMKGNLAVILFISANLLLVSYSYALKECIEPIRQSTRDSDPKCGDDAAFVPQAICHSGHRNVAPVKECSDHDNHDDMHLRGSDVCAFVVEAFFAEWRMLDAAFLLSSSCHADIAAGDFTAIDALQVLPENNELVGIELYGSDFLRVLEESLVQYYVHNQQGSYPHTAGIKYQLDLLAPKGERIKDAKVMGFMCNWKPLQQNERYKIMTNSVLADTIFSSSSSLHKMPTKRGEAESLFLYATSVCTLSDNWHKMRLYHDPKTIPVANENMAQKDDITQRTVTATI